MSSDVIDRMVSLVEDGYAPDSVWESSLTFHPGSSVKINQTVTAVDPSTGSSVTVPEGEVVTVLGVGGGDSGNDGHVLRADGASQAIVPYRAMGENLRKVGENPIEESLSDVVAKVTLSKPLPASVVSWLRVGYMDYEVSLPMHPESDSASSITFLMKARDQEMLDMAKEHLKKEAGSSYKSDAVASMTDWEKATD
ncbi:MAG: hypothetical protein MJA83_16630 [Gammaproteobacteria bacterium]|nr:hypothetical protein [Gammaproteobacteria bacterium]